MTVFVDIAVANDKVPNRIHWGTADGWRSKGQPFGDPGAASRSLEIADMDNDGDLDLVVANVWLGHESVETTNVDVHANLAMKEEALAKIQPMDTPFRRLRPDDQLLAFLESL
jgi:hypothetical protein